MEHQILHLIYIHGFQGDETTFQAFPTDLHNNLLPRLASSHPNVELKSTLYPTYKSKHPLTEATRNFLSWLRTQPAGYVILMGHSMGGLLAAEACTTKEKDTEKREQKIIGMVAFDTPYLGMHPHVIISGIASLFPQDDGKTKNERQLNEHEKVTFVSQGEVKKSESQSMDGQSLLSVDSSSRVSGASGEEWDKFKSSSSLPLSPSASGSSPSEPKGNFLSKTVDFVAKVSEGRFVKFVSKHRDDPIGAVKRWVLDRFAFGVLMFEPRELLARYKVLEEWDGLWVNYWTTTVERVAESDDPMGRASSGSESDVSTIEDALHKPEEGKEQKNAAGTEYEDRLLHPRSEEWPVGPPTKSEQKAVVKEIKGEMKKAQKTHLSPPPSPRPKVIKAHHFITLPSRAHPTCISKWEKVSIHEVKSEVEAHVGMFIQKHNVEYEELVERVGTRVLGWMAAKK